MKSWHSNFLFGPISTILTFLTCLTKENPIFNIKDLWFYCDTSKKKVVKFPYYASVSDVFELEVYVALDQMLQYSEIFSIHPPDEPPMLLYKNNVSDFVGGKNLEVLITPSVIRSDESLKSLEPSDRSCYMEGERKLRFFKVYTRRNCEIECFSNYSLQSCKCVPFEFVRNTNTRVCGLEILDQVCRYQTDNYYFGCLIRAHVSLLAIRHLQFWDQGNKAACKRVSQFGFIVRRQSENLFF